MIVMAKVFSNPFYTKEVGTWLDRAAPEDKSRFERVFAELGLPDASETQAVYRKPPMPPQQRSDSSAGWSYAATKKVSRSPQALKPTEKRPSSSHSDEPVSSMVEHNLSRPSSAPRGSHHRMDRELQKLYENGRALRPSSANGRKNTEGSSGTQKADTSPFSTTYKATYNAREDNPELFEQALQFLKSEPVPNYTLISEWGDTLKANNDETWRKKFMKSMYTSACEDIGKFETDFDKTKEAAYFEWMLKQKTYYGDILQNIPKEDLEAIFSEADLEKRREILETLRQVHSVSRPQELKSHSHVVHCPMAKTEDPKLTAMLTEQIRIRTLGKAPPQIRKEDLPKPGERFPHPSETLTSGSAMTRPPRPASASAKMLSLQFNEAEGGGRPLSRSGSLRSSSHVESTGPVPELALGKEKVRPLTALAQKQTRQLNQGARPMSASGMYKKKETKKTVIETQKSKVPLNWPGHMSATTTSTYKDTFGKRPSSSSQYQAIRIKDTTCPMGAVDKHTASIPFREVYAVPECFVQKLPFPLPTKEVDTIYRQDFYTRHPDDTIRTTREAAYTMDLSHKEARRTEIPFGKKGITQLPSSQWKSEHDDKYTEHVLDIRGDRLRAEALKASLSGPTAAAGALTASHKAPVTKIQIGQQPDS